MAQSSVSARKTLYNDKTFSDIKIRQAYKGQTVEYLAHKPVLCARPAWFMKALTGRFMVCMLYALRSETAIRNKEASANTIEVHNDDPKAFEEMMQFFYETESGSPSMSYPKTCMSFTEVKLIPILKLHALAEKYDVPSLRPATADDFEDVGKDFAYFLDYEAFDRLVHAHYPFCTAPMCDMSQALVNFVIRKGYGLMRHSKIDDLMMHYGNLGRENVYLGQAC